MNLGFFQAKYNRKKMQTAKAKPVPFLYDL